MKLEAFVMINVNLGCETEVLRTLKNVKGFDEAFYVLGDYDIIAKMTSKTIDELNQVVIHIRKLPNVKATATMITREL